MTTGTTGQKIVAGVSPNFCYYNNYVVWSGADRPENLMYPPLDGKVRYRDMVETVRVEGHTVVRRTSVPMVYKDRWDTQSIEDLAAWRTEHVFQKSWDFCVLGELVIDYSIAQGPFAGTYDHSYVGTVSAAGGLPLYPPEVWSADDDYKILSALQERVHGSDFNMASFIGAEGIDTVNFLADTATKLYRAGLAARRANIGKALAILRDAGQLGQPNRKRLPMRMSRAEKKQQLDVYKDLRQALLHKPGFDRGKPPPWYAITANQWLEYHLAAAPLLADVQAAAEMLAHKLEVPQRRAYSAKRERKSSYPPVTGGLEWKVNTLSVKRQIKYVVEELPSVARLSGLFNPEVVLWNALPLTFVSDYVYPIGQWLELRAFVSGLTGVFVTSTKTEWFADQLHWVNSPSAFYSGTVTTGQSTAYQKRGSLDRSVSSTLDVPLPKFRPLGALRSWQRATTVVALVTAIGSSSLDIRHTR